MSVHVIVVQNTGHYAGVAPESYTSHGIRQTQELAGLSSLDYF